MRSLLIFGASGNGKTIISEAVTRLLSGSVWIPHAILINGETVVVYDAAYHRALDGTDKGDPLQYDARWVHSRHPIVRAGANSA